MCVLKVCLDFLYLYVRFPDQRLMTWMAEAAVKNHTLM